MRLQLERYFAAWTVIAVAMVPSAYAEEFCGSTNPASAQIVLAAIAGHALCNGVGEISNQDAGLLAGASGVSLDTPTCEKDSARYVLGLQAAHAKAPIAWCNQIKEALRAHPMTRDLVLEPETSACGENDRVAALVSKAVIVCGFKPSKGGQMAMKLKTSDACVDEERDALDANMKVVQGSLGDEAGRASWCKALFKNHDEQMEALGLKSWFSPE